MAESTWDWFGGLVAFAEDHRQRRPLRPTTNVTAAAAEGEIIAASLAARLAELDAAGSAWRDRTGSETEPAVVVTTSAVGIAAVAKLLATSPEFAAVAATRLVAVTELEYRLWCVRHPDVDHRLHVNVWSWLKTSVPQRRWHEFAAFPLAAGEMYWLHREGVAGAGPLDRRVSHLWRWNGRHASLLRAYAAERGL